MGVVEIGLGVLSLSTVVLAGAGRRRDCDDLAVSATLLLGWTVSAALRDAVKHDLLTTEFISLANPVMDLATGLVVAALFRRRPERWKMAVLLLLMAQIGSHAAFAISDKSFAARYAYPLWLNLSFVAQLACSGSRGASDVIATAIARLRRRALARAHGRARA